MIVFCFGVLIISWRHFMVDNVSFNPCSSSTGNLPSNKRTRMWARNTYRPRRLHNFTELSWPLRWQPWLPMAYQNGFKQSYSRLLRWRVPHADRIWSYNATRRRTRRFPNSVGVEWPWIVLSVDLIPFQRHAHPVYFLSWLRIHWLQTALLHSKMFIHPIETTRLKNRFDFLCKEAKPLCGGLLEDDSGMLTCPPFSAEPNYYDNNVDCQWLIQGLTHQNILFQFHEFSTEPGRDIVTVIDPMLNSTTVLTHSGRSIPGPILSKGNSLVVRFKSDAYMHDILGFRAQYFKVHNEWLWSETWRHFSALERKRV